MHESTIFRARPGEGIAAEDLKHIIQRELNQTVRRAPESLSASLVKELRKSRVPELRATALKAHALRHPTLFLRLANTWASDPSEQVRATCLELVALAAHLACEEGTNAAQKHAREVLSRGLADRCPTVRESAKESLWILDPLGEGR